MNPIFVKMGLFEIYWYSIFILIAFVIGGIIALKEAKRFQISNDFMYNMFFYLIPIVIVGARIYYVIFNLDYYLINPIDIFKIWEGGLAIHGGLIAGLLFIIFYTKKHNVNLIRILDIIVVSVILGQAIGRWGNFFNGEAYGPIVDITFLQKLHLPNFIIDGMYIDGFYHHPTFLYESIWCLLGFIVMLLLRCTKTLRLGQITSFYLIWYGTERFFVEGLRTDSLMLGNMKIAQIISIIMVLIGIYGFILSKKKLQSKKYYNDKENVYGNSV